MVKQRFDWMDIIIYTVLGLLGITMLYPFINMLAISFAPINEVMENSSMIFPKSPTLNAYNYIFKYGEFANATKVTLFITIVGTLLNLSATSIAAFALAKRDLPGGKVFMKYIVISMIFHGGMIPQYIVYRNLGILNTIWVLLLPRLIDTYWLIIMRNYILGIPESISEAARIDGCSEFRLMATIILPLCGPILATLVLIYGVAHWNAYTEAVMFITDNNLMPLQVVIRNLYNSGVSAELDDGTRPPTETVRAAAVMLVTFPVIVAYPFLQKYFVQGATVGAVKG